MSGPREFATPRFVVIDKGDTMTSFACVQRVRSLLGVRRVGHAGTLDPFATGVLVCGVGPATRLLGFLSEGDKEYVADIRFGRATDSLDRTGKILESRPVSFVGEELEEACGEFVGDSLQVPPRLSAVKVEGQRSHRRFRQGDTEFALEPRPVRIHAIELLAFEDECARVRVVCDGGTYIRSLARDLGERLNTVAHVEELRRTRVGTFSLDDSVTLEELEGAGPEPTPGVHPVEDLVRGWTKVPVDSEQARRLRQGVQPRADWVGTPDPPCTRVAYLGPDEDLVAIAERGERDFRLRVVLPLMPGGEA